MSGEPRLMYFPGSSRRRERERVHHFGGYRVDHLVAPTGEKGSYLKTAGFSIGRNPVWPGFQEVLHQNESLLLPIERRSRTSPRSPGVRNRREYSSRRDRHGYSSLSRRQEEQGRALGAVHARAASIIEHQGTQSLILSESSLIHRSTSIFPVVDALTFALPQG